MHKEAIDKTKTSYVHQLFPVIMLLRICTFDIAGQGIMTIVTKHSTRVTYGDSAYVLPLQNHTIETCPSRPGKGTRPLPSGT